MWRGKVESTVLVGVRRSWGTWGSISRGPAEVGGTGKSRIRRQHILGAWAWEAGGRTGVSCGLRRPLRRAARQMGRQRGNFGFLTSHVPHRQHKDLCGTALREMGEDPHVWYVMETGVAGQTTLFY